MHRQHPLIAIWDDHATIAVCVLVFLGVSPAILLLRRPKAHAGMPADAH